MATKKAADETAPIQQNSETTLRRKAYSSAETLLKQRHTDEFKSLVQEEAKRLGVTYVFRETPEEKAAKQMQTLLAQFPHLASQVQTSTEQAPAEQV